MHAFIHSHRQDRSISNLFFDMYKIFSQILDYSLVNFILNLVITILYVKFLTKSVKVIKRSLQSN